ncbi:MAG: N-acetylmuramic acid 6-phosphate etherase, partial [Arenibacter sp.]
MSEYQKITELPSKYNDLELMDTATILTNMNKEDQLIADAVALVIPEVTKLVDALKERFDKGGRLFYIGAGTSGRLGILDASEIPPTFGLSHDYVIGLIAGGDVAIRKA